MKSAGILILLAANCSLHKEKLSTQLYSTSYPSLVRQWSIRALQGCVFTSAVAAAWVQAVDAAPVCTLAMCISSFTAHSPACSCSPGPVVQLQAGLLCLTALWGIHKPSLCCPSPIFLHWSMPLQLLKIPKLYHCYIFCILVNWSYTLATHFTCSSTCIFCILHC